MSDQEAKYIVPGLDRGLRLLSIFTKASPELSMADIMRRINLPYATTYRLLRTLEFHGLLKKTTIGFALGPGILHFGFDYLSTLSVAEVAHPEMMALRDDTGASANLGILETREVIYVAHVPSLRPLATRLVVGSRMPAHSSSIGRLILGWKSPDEIRTLFKGVNLNTPNVKYSSVDALIRVVQEDRERGYVITRGIYDVGIVAVAAPIFDQTSQVVAGINVSGPASSLDTGALDGAIKDRVCASAAKISALLGYRP